jgi:hypothetical protein
MRTFTLILTGLLALSTVFGQTVTKLSPEESARAWQMLEGATASSKGARSASSVPTLSGAAIVSKPTIDSHEGGEFTAVIAVSGIYLMQASLCDGSYLHLGSWNVQEVGDKGRVATIPIVNTKVVASGANSMPSFCRISLFKVDGGMLLGQSTSTSTALEKHTFGVLGESFLSNGEYFLALTGIDSASTVALGTTALATRTEIVGPTTKVYFNKDLLVAVRNTMVTVCDPQGNCKSLILTRSDSVLGIGNVPKG